LSGIPAALSIRLMREAPPPLLPGADRARAILAKVGTGFASGIASKQSVRAFRVTQSSQETLEHFVIQWKPVNHQKMRQNIDLERVFDSIKNKSALEIDMIVLQIRNLR
jgi:hypothetical protein